MPLKRLKKSFAAGEIDPLMGARVDFSKYKDACKVLKNMICLPTGAATRRPGLELILDMSGPGVPGDPGPGQGPLAMIPATYGRLSEFIMVLYGDEGGDLLIAINKVGTSVTWFYNLTNELDDSPAGYKLGNDLSYAQNGYETYCTCKDIKPFIIRYNTGDVWEFQTVPFVDEPPDWEVGGLFHYPYSVAFHQQRLLFGGNKVRPQAIWCSAIAEPHNFGPHTSIPGISDGFSFQLDSTKWGAIRWLHTGKVLSAGTALQEWVITGPGGGGPISGIVSDVSGVEATVHTDVGSSPGSPYTIHGSVNFLDKYGSGVFEFKYQFSMDGYQTSDKSVLSRHLTRGKYMRKLAYQENPYGVLWAQTYTSEFLGCTLVPEHKVAGWHRHDTNGDVLAMVTVPSELYGTDVLYMIVQRLTSDGTHTLLERLATPWVSDSETLSEPEQQKYDTPIAYLDSFVYRTPVGTLVTGLGHLAGQTVGVVTDGSTHPDVVVTFAGEITLNHDGYSLVAIGHKYVSEVRPYLADINTQEGTAYGQMQRIVSLDIDFYNTRGGEVGVSYQEEDGSETERTEDLQFRTPATSMNTPIPMFTGIYNFTFHEGNDRKSEYFIRQVHPQPMTIRGITDSLEVG